MSKNILKQVSVKGSTGKTYKVSQLKDKSWGCSCPRWINTTPRKDCKHIIAAQKGKTVVAKIKKQKSNGGALLGRKTTRAAVIGLLLQHKNKLVPMPTVVATVVKVTGKSKESAAKRIKAKNKMFAHFAKQHKFHFVASNNGLKLATA